MRTALPDPRTAAEFRFTTREYDPGTGVVSLGFRFDDGPELLERIQFPHAPWPPEASRQAAFQQALVLLHGLAGVSYYKAGLPPLLSFPGGDAELLGFLTRTYVHGLAEFGYVNGLEVEPRVVFRDGGPPPHGLERSPGPGEPALPERALVAMGGGKDSLVGLELSRQAGLEVMPVCVGGSPLIAETARAAGLPLLRIGRQLAPELADMNRAGAWNGHVPVTAINSAILACAAILYGFGHVVFSNERSADEATLLTADGRAVNHQYSKGSAFERDFRERLASRVTPALQYFSILRPFSELEVMRRFSALTSFHGVFSSCNRNFHLDGPRIDGRWCLDCPKCRFAALGFALFLPPAAVVGMLGADLLDDPAQEEGFRALCGLGRDKPFECVGETGESRAALAGLEAAAAWKGHAVVRVLAPELRSVEVPALDRVLQPADRHCIPARICHALGLPLSAPEARVGG